MREDMFKVIVERPRLVNSNPYSGDGRKYRNSDEAPSRLGMKRGYNWTKYLNENLAPLKRYLASQVNRPWDKVYSDIRASIDGRSTVKQHVLQHIADFVARDTHWVETPEGGRIVVRSRGWPWRDQFLDESQFELFVHPRTGILLRNRHWVSYDARRRMERLQQQQARSRVRKILSEDEQLHQFDGVWYHVSLAVLPAARTEVVEATPGTYQRQTVHDSCWDVLRSEWVSREHGERSTDGGNRSNKDMYGDPVKCAVTKRQLGRRELRKYGISCSDTSGRR